MQPRDLAERVEILERTVEGLSDLPGRMAKVEGRLETVEVQIVQLRTEMRSEFSAIRAEIRQGDEQTRTFMRVLNEETRSDVRMLAEGLSDTREQLTVFRSEFDFFVARAEAFRVRTEAFQARNDAFQEDVRAQLAVIAARRTRKKR
jgi:hypothetical protein